VYKVNHAIDHMMSNVLLPLLVTGATACTTMLLLLCLRSLSSLSMMDTLQSCQILLVATLRYMPQRTLRLLAVHPLQYSSQLFPVSAHIQRFKQNAVLLSMCFGYIKLHTCASCCFVIVGTGSNSTDTRYCFTAAR
jgi:hypothetical protein